MPEEVRPPYVRFEVRSVEDRNATIEAGHFVGKDVIFAIVTPTGSRDVVEREVDDWLANLEESAKQERIPSFWVDAYRRSLQNFKESRETPEEGTSIRDWPGAAPSQIRTMLDINVRTVEELAQANEETLGRIGMGARALKQKAIIWLEQANDQGKSSERLVALEIANEEYKTNNEALSARIIELEKLIAAQKEEV
jgi:hypothetical protein